VVGTWNAAQVFGKRIDGVVDGKDLGGILMILIDDSGAREFRHAHDAVGVIHAVLLDGVDGGVDMSARTVKVGGMHMNAERFATDHLGVHAGRIVSQSWGVDDVKAFGTGNDAGDDGELLISSCRLPG
jgi:hypothetical protein